MNFRLIINLHNATDKRQPIQKYNLRAGFRSLKDEGACGNFIEALIGRSWAILNKART
jgi:hypothetical protein